MFPPYGPETQGPISDGKVVIKGKTGQNVSESEGIEAAKLAALNALAVIKQSLGDLEKVARVVKLNGYELYRRLRAAAYRDERCVGATRGCFRRTWPSCAPRLLPMRFPWAFR